MTDSERLKYAQWVLERNLAWGAAAEVKVGVIVAMDTGMLGALASLFGGLYAYERTTWITALTIAAAAILGIAIACAASAVLPRMEGPVRSFIFFGKIVKDQAPDYSDKFRRATAQQILDDCLAQIHRNAEIVCQKFIWVRRAMGWSFLGVVPWVLAIALIHWT
jgi:hypothetical protein